MNQDPRSTSYIDAIHVPEIFQGTINNYGADIAILILSTELQLTAYVQPVCIDLETENDEQFNAYGTIIEWRYIKKARLTVLQEKAVSVISYNKCFERMPKWFRKYLTNDKICVEYNCDDTWLAYSVNGNALVSREESTDRYFVKGIRSLSPKPQDTEKCQSNGTYTSVTAHINFIRKLLAFNTR